MILLLTIAITVGAVFLLALVSEGFGYAVSRVVEPLFDSIEYRLASRVQKLHDSSEDRPQSRITVGTTSLAGY